MTAELLQGLPQIRVFHESPSQGGISSDDPGLDAAQHRRTQDGKTGRDAGQTVGEAVHISGIGAVDVQLAAPSAWAGSDPSHVNLV
jgi:hypothetical protein